MKDPSNPWPSILGFLIVVLIIIYLIGLDEQHNPSYETQQQQTGP